MILTLSHNNLKKIPDSIKKLLRLFTLSLSGNPLEARPSKSYRGMLWYSLPSNVRLTTRDDYPDGLDPQSYPDED